MNGLQLSLGNPICVENDRSLSALTSVLKPYCSEERAEHLASDLIHFYGSMHAVLRAPSEKLRHLFGLNADQCAALKQSLATIECIQTEKLPERVHLGTEDQIVDFVEFQLRYLRTESVLILCLDAGRSILDVRSFVGACDGSFSLDVRELTAHVLGCNARFLILAHNHPSGESRPSPEDIRTTLELGRTLGRLGVSLLDHLVVGEQTFSMAKNALFQFQQKRERRSRLNLSIAY